MSTILRVFKGTTAVLDYRLPLGRTVLGRADNCDVAVPDEQVSRTHCFVERSTGGVQVVDRSRHGTFVNGQRVEKAPLQDGDRLQIGGFTFELHEGSDTLGRAHTAPVVPDASHEEFLGVDPDGLAVIRLSLRVVSGPASGMKLALPAADVTVGSVDSQLCLPDPDLLARHFRLLTNHGRASIIPMNGAVAVDKKRIRGAFPLYPGETFSAGGSQLQVVPIHDEEHPESAAFHDMIGDSDAMRRVFGLLRRMAGTHETVLLQGESGTGKELAARGLHFLSPRADGPFVPINCGAITESLFESELFGHEKGAFTGAIAQRDGAFHLADGGTLFLDEVGEIPISAQAKLLRALESGEVRRLGSPKATFPDVRVVAATNRNLPREVQDRAFREDLYFRLAVLTIRLPPLRERPEDIAPLCQSFCTQLGPQVHVTPAALDILCAHPWPGNVRELRNVLTRAAVLHGPIIEPAALTFSPIGLPSTDLYASDRADPTEDAERAFCEAALQRHRGNRAAAARELGLPRTTFLYKLRRLGLE